MTTRSTMNAVRPAVDRDRAAVVEVVIAAGMFDRDGARVVDDLLRDKAPSAGSDEYRCVVAERDGEVVGVGFAEVRPVTDRVWELTMLGVHPDDQRAGHGAAMLATIEREVAAHGARLMVVETSATAEFSAARAFYARSGYDEEARIRDYWTDGDDLVVFTKPLRGAARRS